MNLFADTAETNSQTLWNLFTNAVETKFKTFRFHYIIYLFEMQPNCKEKISYFSRFRKQRLYTKTNVPTEYIGTEKLR